VGSPIQIKLTVEQTPQHIIDGCIAQQAQSQEQLYKLLYAEMMKVCFRYTLNEHDAAALYNEAMLKGFAKIKQYKFEGSFNGWIKRIVINTCLDYCRKHTHYNKQQWLDESKAEQISIDESVSSTITAKEIMELVAELPKNTAIVFNMFVVDGFKHNEIGKALGISEGTSKWHLNEARKLLKQKITNQLEFKKYN
jgi:RNA polymerase sigma-70 factor, ECF subfamily